MKLMLVGVGHYAVRTDYFGDGEKTYLMGDACSNAYYTGCDGDSERRNTKKQSSPDRLVKTSTSDVGIISIQLLRGSLARSTSKQRHQGVSEVRSLEDDLFTRPAVRQEDDGLRMDMLAWLAATVVRKAHVFAAYFPARLLLVQTLCEDVTVIAQTDDDVALDRPHTADLRRTGRGRHGADGDLEFCRRGRGTVVRELC